MKKCHKASRVGAAVPYDKGTEAKKPMSDLSSLSNDALEVMANDFLVAGDIDGEELCLLEMIRRNHYPTAWLDELLEMAA